MGGSVERDAGVEGGLTFGLGTSLSSWMPMASLALRASCMRFLRYSSSSTAAIMAVWLSWWAGSRKCRFQPSRIMVGVLQISWPRKLNFSEAPMITRMRTNMMEPTVAQGCNHPSHSHWDLALSTGPPGLLSDASSEHGLTLIKARMCMGKNSGADQMVDGI